MNRPKAKGTAGETAVVRYLRANGFPHAERRALRGSSDAGDVLATAGLIFEVKVRATAGTGQPGGSLLAEWMAQAEAERSNAGADFCPLVVKRAGTTDVGRWFAYLPLRDLVRLSGRGAMLMFKSSRDVTTQLAMADLVGLLRGAGYGEVVA